MFRLTKVRGIAMREATERMTTPFKSSIEATTRRRVMLCNAAPTCPKCPEKAQIQLVEWVNTKPAQWRCRTCKHAFTFEPAT